MRRRGSAASGSRRCRRPGPYVYARVSGDGTEANAALEGDPSLVNTSPEGEGWFFRLTLADPAELNGLMDEAAYKAFVDGL